MRKLKVKITQKVEIWFSISKICVHNKHFWEIDRRQLQWNLTVASLDITAMRKKNHLLLLLLHFAILHRHTNIGYLFYFTFYASGSGKRL